MWILSPLILLACTPEPECRADLRVYEDLDGDGWGTVELEPVCELGAGQSEQPLDCDDANVDVHPEATERCDGTDENCDGSIDEGFDRDLFYQDSDGDGFGGSFPAELACEAPGGKWVRNAADCDDEDADVNPDARERCKGGDEDCDGLAGDFDDSVDPDTYDTFFRDADGDSHGNRNRTTEACDAPAGFVPFGDDCDDDDPNFSQNLYYEDDDDDGFGDATAQRSGCTPPAGTVSNPDDCDDTDSDITNEHDWFTDADGDGFGEGVSLGFGCVAPFPDLVAFGGDCAPADPDENPGIPEDCQDNLDQNCNGLVDCADGDCSLDPLCVPPCADDVLVGSLPISVAGSTVGQGNDESGSCGGTTAAEVVFQWVPDTSGTVTIDTIGSAYDTLLYVRAGCGGAQLACNDDAVGLQSRVNVNVTAGDAIIIVVDGYSGAGSYVLNVQ
jgi:hypothetical protein